MSGCDRFIRGWKGYVRCGGTDYARGTGPDQCGCDDGPEEAVHLFEVRLRVRVPFDPKIHRWEPEAHEVEDAFKTRLDDVDRRTYGIDIDDGQEVYLGDDCKTEGPAIEVRFLGVES